MSLSEEEVLQQSKTAFRQWEDLWRLNCTKNGELYKKSEKTLNDLLFKGAGKTGIVIALGHSFEKQIDILKKHDKDRKYDILCVDKCFGYLVDQGIYPDYVILADAQVGHEWMDGRDTSKSTLIANVNANPEWTQNWKGPIIFYVNKDNIQSEKIFSEISGCHEMIPASSNVGNAAVMLCTTVFDYDKTILVGYDYCYYDKYYAFSEHTDKRYWMSHRIALDHTGRIVKTSENLVFSARWLDDYIKVTKPRIFNSSRETILSRTPFVDLDRQLEAAKIKELPEHHKNAIIQKLTKKVLVRSRVDLDEMAKKFNINNIFVEVLPEVLPWQS